MPDTERGEDGPATSTPADAAGASDDGEGIAVTEGPGGRDVVVPLRLYKTVIVFSTLVAVVAVVLGFMFLDAATLQVSVLRGVVIALVGLVSVSVPEQVLSAALAVTGLLVIGFGAVVYTLGTRFRARGMGKSQEDSEQASNNG